MKKMIIPMLVIMLLVTGCKQIPKLENGKEAVVSLKNGDISVDDLYDEMKSKYALSVLIDMIDKQLLNDKYEETDEEKTYISESKSGDEQFYASSYKTYEQFLQERFGVNNEGYLDDLFRLQYRRNQYVEEYAKSIVTESEIKDYYENDYIPDIEASHILITADYATTATEEEKKAAEEAALNTAKEVITKLNNGEDFAELAKAYSKDGSSSKGGDLGRFGHGDMVTEFETAAYKLKVGEYTKEPVKTKYGYHIILKTKEYEKEALEEAKEEIITTLSQKILSEDSKISYKALENLRDEYDIEIEDSTLKQQYENYLYNTTN